MGTAWAARRADGSNEAGERRRGPTREVEPFDESYDACFFIFHMGCKGEDIKHMRDAASPVLYSQESYLK